MAKATLDDVLMKIFQNHLYGAGIFLHLLRYILRVILTLPTTQYSKCYTQTDRHECEVTPSEISMASTQVQIVK